jgi:hypothetical protein
LISFLACEECQKNQLRCEADPSHRSCRQCRQKKLRCTNTGQERRTNKRREAKKAKEGRSRGDRTTGHVRSGSRVTHRRTGRSAHRANDGYERPATRIDELKERITRLERAARQTSRRDAEAQSAAWYTHAGVETLLEIIQMAFPGAFPDAVAFLHQQTAVCKPVGEHPHPDAYDEFRAKRRSAAKRKTEGDNSEDDREEERGRKRRRIHKKNSGR